MSIIIKAIEQRDETRQVAFFTIDGQEFSAGNVPATLTKTEDIQAHLDARADEFNLLILKKSYPESDHKRFLKEGMTEIQSMQEWIAKGHKNLIDKKGTKNIYIVIDKQELEYRHPKSVGLMAKIEGAGITPELKDLLKEIVR